MGANGIHRICRRLRHDGWRGGNENENRKQHRAANCPSKLGGRAKRRGYALVPSDKSVNSKYILLTPEKYLPEGKSVSSVFSV